MPECGKAQDPVAYAEMPPHVQVKNRKLGEEALRTDSHEQRDQREQLHAPELQNAPQILLDAHLP